jgi:hypothetical protein
MMKRVILANAHDMFASAICYQVTLIAKAAAQWRNRNTTIPYRQLANAKLIAPDHWRIAHDRGLPTALRCSMLDRATTAIRNVPVQRLRCCPDCAVEAASTNILDELA